MPREADSTRGAGSGSTTTSRRGFLTTAALVGAPLLASRRAAFASQASSRITLGVIGCGGRGEAVSGGFLDNTNTRIHAIADLFDFHCPVEAQVQAVERERPL